MIGKGLVVLFCGLIARIGGAMLITSKQRYTWREQIFISIAWIPKATVQAAIGGIILTTAEESGGSAEFIEFGQIIITTAVFAIVITAPLGSIFTLSAGEKLMTHDGTPEELSKLEADDKSGKVAPIAQTEEDIVKSVDHDIKDHADITN